MFNGGGVRSATSTLGKRVYFLEAEGYSQRDGALLKFRSTECYSSLEKAQKHLDQFKELMKQKLKDDQHFRAGASPLDLIE